MPNLRRAVSRGFLAAVLLATPLAIVVGIPTAAIAADPVCITNGTILKGPFTVPAGVTSYNTTLYGQAGQDWFANADRIAKGGRGMVMTGSIAVAPGDQVVVGKIPGAPGGAKAPQYHPTGADNIDGRYNIEPAGADGGKGGDAQYVAKVVGGCQVPLLVSAGGGGAGGGYYGGGYGGAPDTVNGPQGGGDGGANNAPDGGGGHGAISFSPCTINSGGCTGIGGSAGYLSGQPCPNGINGQNGVRLGGGAGGYADYDYPFSGKAPCNEWAYGAGGGGAGFYYGGGGASGIGGKPSGGGGGGSPYAATGSAWISTISEVGPHSWKREVNGNSPASPVSGGAVLPAPIFKRISDSTTTVTASKSLSAEGEEVVFNVTVTPTADDIAIQGGSLVLAIYKGGNRLENSPAYPVEIHPATAGAKSYGTAAIPVANLPVGTINIVAAYTGYSGTDIVRESEAPYLTNEVRKSQSISFTSAIPTNAKALTGPYTPTATATSGAAVTFSSGTSTICSVANGVVSFLNAGTCVVKADQGGTGTYFSAPTASQSINVAAVGGQTITFTSTPQFDPLGIREWYFPKATGGASGNPVTFSTGTQTNCQLDGGGKLTFTWGGDCIVYAHQDAGNGLAAGEASQTVHVHPADASIRFMSGDDVVGVGGTYNAVVEASPGKNATISVGSQFGSCVKGPTTLTSTPTGSRAQATITFTKRGTCLVNATDPGLAPLYSGATVVKFLGGVGRAQTISFAAHAENLRYGLSDTTVVNRGPSTGDLRFTSSTPSVCTTPGNGTWTFVGAGTCTFSVFQNGDDYYEPSNELTYSYQVGKRGLVVTPEQVGTAGYGTAPVMKATYDGFAFDDAEADLTTPPTCTSNTDATTPVGEYAGASCSGAASEDYNFVYSTGKVTITRPAVTVTAPDVTKVYGAVPAALTPTYAGLPGSMTSLPGVTCSANVTAASPVGTYQSTCSGPGDPGYDVTYVKGTVTIGKAPLQVLAVQSGTATYGSSVAVAPSYSGFVGSDSAASLATRPSCSSSTVPTTAPGTYPGQATCSGGVSGNYALSYTAGTVTISKAVLTITASNAAGTFGGATTAVTPSYSGFVLGQDIAAVTTKPTCSSGTTATTGAGLYLATSSCSGAVAANYALTYVKGIVTIAKAPVTVTVPAITRFASVKAGKMTFVATVKNTATGAAAPGVIVTFSVTAPATKATFGCTATTGATGQATCTSGNGNYLFVWPGTPVRATSATTANYLAGSGTVNVS